MKASSRFCFLMYWSKSAMHEIWLGYHSLITVYHCGCSMKLPWKSYLWMVIALEGWINSHCQWRYILEKISSHWYPWISKPIKLSLLQVFQLKYVSLSAEMYFSSMQTFSSYFCNESNRWNMSYKNIHDKCTYRLFCFYSLQNTPLMWWQICP